MSEIVQDSAPEEIPAAGAADAGAPVSVPVSNKRWYVVHAYSGMEKSVMRALTERIERAGVDHVAARVAKQPASKVEIAQRTAFPVARALRREVVREARRARAAFVHPFGAAARSAL